MADGEGLVWQPENPPALQNVQELIVQGICRVRNSYIHGEKFTGGPNEKEWERDRKLVAEAMAVLEAARDREARMAIWLASKVFPGSDEVRAEGE